MILLGAIGGVVASGFIGLFVGAVVLALGYTLLHAWLNKAVRAEPKQDQLDPEDRVPKCTTIHNR